MGRFGAAKKGNDLDDLGDSINFDEILGGPTAPSGPPRQNTFGGGGSSYTGISSAKNTKPASRLE
jgi:hypothetical protein